MENLISFATISEVELGQMLQNGADRYGTHVVVGNYQVKANLFSVYLAASET